MVNPAAVNGTAVPLALPNVDTGGTILSTLGYLCLLLAVIFFAYWLLKRLGFHGMGVQSGSGAPRLLTRLMLGGRQSVAVVRYRGKDMVLGVTEDRVNLLREFDAEGDDEAPQPRNFAAMLKRSGDNDE